MRYPAEPIVVSSKTPFTFTSNDGGPIPSGVASVNVFIDGLLFRGLRQSSASLFFEASLTVPSSFPDGVHLVSWQGADHVSNTEVAGRRAITLDNTPPDALLTEPDPGDRIHGNQKVEGTANDLHFDFYRLEFAVTGTTVYFPIERQSLFGSAVTNGLLARWFAAHLPRGSYTLRMTVQDVVENSSTVTVDGFKGGRPGTIVSPPPPIPLPAFIRSIGGKGKGAGDLRLPVGVTAGADGQVYVSDTQHHRIEVFNSMAEFDFEFGRHGAANGHFNQPEGVAVAVGSQGRLYVADRYND
ncbi:MAG: hypothetical protein AAB368_06130, partial [bacterium]